jgi:hypothetical protein
MGLRFTEVSVRSYGTEIHGGECKVLWDWGSRRWVYGLAACDTMCISVCRYKLAMYGSFPSLSERIKVPAVSRLAVLAAGESMFHMLNDILNYSWNNNVGAIFISFNQCPVSWPLPALCSGLNESFCPPPSPIALRAGGRGLNPDNGCTDCGEWEG